MKQNDLLMIGVAALGLMMIQRQAKAKGNTTPTTTKPAVQGASLATMGQYWTSLLGKDVGDAVAAGKFKPNVNGDSNAATYYQPVDTTGAGTGSGDESVFWGIE